MKYILWLLTDFAEIAAVVYGMIYHDAFWICIGIYLALIHPDIDDEEEKYNDE